jgi:voltage-gated potassium channel
MKRGFESGVDTLKTAGAVINDITLAPMGALGRQMVGRPLSWWVERFLLILVFVRFGVYIIETDIIMSVNSHKSPPVFLWVERFIAVVFTIEYFVRWRTSTNPRKWPRKFTAFVDLMSFMPFWVGFYVPESALGLIRGMRTISLIKFYRYSPKAQAIFQEVYRMKSMLKQVFLINIFMLLFFGSIMFEIERHAQPDKFTRVFDGIWYSGVTASTTGYGDLYPITLLGRIVGYVLIFLGVAFMSVYIGMFTTAANRAFKKELEEQDKQAALEAAQVPLVST